MGLLRKSGRRWHNGNKMYTNRMRWGIFDWICLAEDRRSVAAVTPKLKKLLLSTKRGEFLDRF
jgi:hypothetical protein